MLEMQVHAQLARPLLQDGEQPLSADADEAVPGGADHLTVNVDVDIVPMGKLAGDDRPGNRIVGHQIFDSLVGEDDPPAERVVGTVALIEIDPVRRIAELHRDGEIEPGRPAPEARDAHPVLQLI